MAAPILAVRGAGITFGGGPLFSGIDLALAPGDHACLVGRNGSGKSTLLKILGGVLVQDDGERFVQPGIRIGHVLQEPDFGAHATVKSYVTTGLPAGEADQEHRVDAILDRFDLRADGGTQGLSGGEARRAALARALVGEPDVLLLDEPTNHLDLQTIQKLEEDLAAYRGALLTISHDRAFLKATAQQVYWLDRGVMRQMSQGFAHFETWQADVFKAEEEAAHKLERKIEAEIQWMWYGGISARRTRNMGRVRALQGLRAEREARVKGGQQVSLSVAEAQTSGKLVLEAEKISKSFGERPIISNFSTRILRRDRVGIIGANGAGKTTLLNMLTGKMAPDQGTIRFGSNLDIAVVDQRRAMLSPDVTIRQILCPHGGDSVIVNGSPRHIASYMRDFLFEARQVDSPMRSLSGGEKNRLLLASIFSKPSNVLVLDEPTNDLDMDTLDLLEDVINDYKGTLLLVSHDRDFLDRLVTSVIAVEGEGKVVESVGGYADYARQKKESVVAAVRPVATAVTPPKETTRSKLSYKDQRELDALPEKMAKLEAEVARLHQILDDTTLFQRDAKAFTDASARLSQAQTDLAGAEERWLELESLRESLEKTTKG